MAAMRLIVIILFVSGLVFTLEQIAEPTGDLWKAIALLIGSAILLNFIPRDSSRRQRL